MFSLTDGSGGATNLEDDTTATFYIPFLKQSS